ncbi:MAG: hypothetical protein F9K44_09685 [Hyphomicrobiaceae bacterium]|nr:MAG: hypothetical protein F9K44_09685 [Hyphomicrobiaceae bacterium]
MRQRLLALREELALFTRASLDSWLQANRLTSEGLERLLAEDAAAAILRRRLHPLLDAAITDELRLIGRYAELAGRAEAKLRQQRGQGRDFSYASSTVTPIELRMWFFSHRIGGGMPHNMLGFAERLGFASLAALDAALLREWRYVENEGRGDGR